MKAIIGVLAEVNEELNTSVQYTYISAIEKAGGIPVLLPRVESTETIEAFVQSCDGFFFTGGADIDPKRYGEEVKSTCGEIMYQRDEFEFRVFQSVIKTSKPILAVCRGAQLVNVALGGTLYQDLPSERPTQILHRQTVSKDAPSHGVKILKDTPLWTLAGKEWMAANSFHHQAVKVLGEGLSVMAAAEDGMIEAMYLKEERYLRAYQWHPERLCEKDEDNQRIFEDFVKACK